MLWLKYRVRVLNSLLDSDVCETVNSFCLTCHNAEVKLRVKVLKPGTCVIDVSYALLHGLYQEDSVTYAGANAPNTFATKAIEAKVSRHI